MEISKLYTNHIELSDGNILARWCGGNDIFKTAAKLLTGINTDESVMDSLASSASVEGDYTSYHMRTPTRTASVQ